MDRTMRRYDWPLGAKLPYLFPLRSVADECASSYAQLPYEYAPQIIPWLT